MTELAAGQMLGKYQIMGPIGQGGMAAVYKGYDPALKRYVAIKVLSSHLAADPQILQRFEREAITSANLKHPNIVVIHDVGSAGGYHFIVMELLEGRTLRQEIRAVGALPLSRVIHITYQLGSALDYAHGHDLVHRDLKPGNVMLGVGDHVTLMDFGLVKALRGARLTEAGTSVGTLEYMSPEQLGGEQVDHRSDVYSLGVVVYELLAGRTPFRSDTPFRLIQNVMYSPPPPLSQLVPGMPVAVEREIERALAKNPNERHRSAGEFAERLYAASTSGEFCLVDAQGRQYRLRRGRNTVGRGAENSLVLNDHQISRFHAEINFEGESWLVVDLNSTNGTFVNETRLIAGKPVRLNPGDVIRFGPTVRLTVTAGARGGGIGEDTLRATRPTHLPGG